ncbi:MAG: magnesium-translocating P-type ATPase [Gammaproteobacteria bacterium]
MPESSQKILSLNPQQALAALGTSEMGLSDQEVQNRRVSYGPNEIIPKRNRSHVLIALSHAANPLVAILLIAAFVSAVTGGMSNALIIIIIVMLSVGLDYIQSHRSLVAAKRLQEQVAATCHVLREGTWVDIPATALVPGDIIGLVAGNMVPADAYLLKARDLHVQEAALTGESLPVEKEIPTNRVIPNNIVECKYAVFAGTSIVSGTGMAVVMCTGSRTEFGAIASRINMTPPPTEFDKGMVRFGLFIMKLVFFVVLFVFIINLYLERSAIESLLFALALAVGMTPELLPMITTVTLAKGALKMAKGKVIVKNLSAIQNIGSINILCSDKTGTLTAGKMELGESISLSGEHSEYVLLLAYLNSLYGTGINNPADTAVLNRVDINPLDAAILRHHHPDMQSYIKMDEIPFDFIRRRASVVVDKSGTHLLITKGAPELILPICTHYLVDGKPEVINDEALRQFNQLFQTESAQGYRVLAVAYREMPPQSDYHADDENNLIIAGLVTFMDPPLNDVAEVIQELYSRGVSIKILTGDNDLVARYVSNAVGIDATTILMGGDLDNISDSALGKLAEEIQVFARVTPAQKQRIITLLRARGYVVGYMGDGINDAPALKCADVGISVSDAVDVAREAADIILLEQSLKVILNGITEGRKSLVNVMKYLIVGTSSNFGNTLSMTSSIFFLPFLPATATQLLLNNLLYDISQISLATDNVDDVFIQKPRQWSIDIVRKFMLYLGPITTVFDLLTFFVMIKVFHASDSLFQTGWFVESLATQVLVIFVVRTAQRCWRSKPSMALSISVVTIVLIAVLLPFSPLATLFGFVPLPMGYFIFLVLATLTYLSLMEVLKKRLMLKWLLDESGGK